MLKRFLVLFMLISNFSNIPHALALGTQPFFKDSFLNLKDDLAEANRAGRILMLVYEQEGCPYCAETHKVNFADKEIVDTIAKHFDVVQLDIWGGRELTDFSGKVISEKQFARDLKIHFSPMITFYSPAGKEIFRMAGYYPPPQFKAAMNFMAGRHYKDTSFREYSLKHTVEPARKGLIDEPFFVKTQNLKSVADTAGKNNKGFALVFEQEQCAGCVEIHETSFIDSEVVAKLTRNFDTVQINLWGKKGWVNMAGNKISEADLGKSLQVRYTPTIIFFDNKGKEILRHESYLKPEHFATLLTYLTTDARTAYSSFQDWLRAKNSMQAETKQTPNL